MKAVLALCLSLLAAPVAPGAAQGAVPENRAQAATVPRTAGRWRGYQTRVARQHLGMDAPVPLMAAQVHQESSWRTDAVSTVGARGLAQVMPGTAAHIEELGGPSARATLSTPRGSLRAQAVYMGWLKERVDRRNPATVQDAWAYVLSGYNGGLGWVDRDRAASPDPGRWYCYTVRVQTRGDAAQRENRHYVPAIKQLQTVYRSAGWHGPIIGKRNCE